MKIKIVLFSIVILTALFLSAFGSPSTPQMVNYQDTAVPPTSPPAASPAVTVVVPTVVVQNTVIVQNTVVVQSTPVVIPVTGTDAQTGIWTLVLFGLLGLLAIAFLVALFSPRSTHEHIDRNPPPPDV